MAMFGKAFAGYNPAPMEIVEGAVQISKKRGLDVLLRWILAPNALSACKDRIP
jgi:hypothetical protein